MCTTLRAWHSSSMTAFYIQYRSILTHTHKTNIFMPCFRCCSIIWLTSLYFLYLQTCSERHTMAATGIWLIIHHLVTTTVYKLLRLVFITVQSIFWQLNGTARKICEARLPENYERSAQVLDVVFVHKFCRGQAITVDNFLCTHNCFEHPQYIIDNDSITLMTITERAAIFCEPAEKGWCTGS